MLQKIHHAAIIVSNYERSKQFYTEKLELPIIRENYRSDKRSHKLDLQIGEEQIELFSFPYPPERPDSPEAVGLRHLSFSVSDIEKTCLWLSEKGIRTEEIRIDPCTGSRYTFFKDPDGLPLELYEEKKGRIQ